MRPIINILLTTSIKSMSRLTFYTTANLLPNVYTLDDYAYIHSNKDKQVFKIHSIQYRHSKKPIVMILHKVYIDGGYRLFKIDLELFNDYIIS